MDISKQYIRLDVNKEKVKLREFFHSNLDKRVGVVYGPKSLEDRYCIKHCLSDKLGFTALMESLELMGFSTIHVDPTGDATVI